MFVLFCSTTVCPLTKIAKQSSFEPATVFLLDNLGKTELAAETYPFGSPRRQLESSISSMNTSSHSSNGGHVTAAASGSSKWTAVTFRNLAPRSDVCVVTLPLETSASSAGREDDDNDNADRAIGNDEPAPTKRILHFVIGGETTTETGEADIVESIEWQCQRCWRMAALNRPRIGCGAALLRGVIYTVGCVSLNVGLFFSIQEMYFSYYSTCRPTQWFIQ